MTERNEAIIIAEDGIVPVVSPPVVAALAAAGFRGFALVNKRNKKLEAA